MEDKRNMDFTMEQIQKAMTAASAEELLAMAKEDGIELTLTEAEEYYSELHQNYEMSDDELSAVAGGKGESYNGFDETIAAKCRRYRPNVPEGTIPDTPLCFYCAHFAKGETKVYGVCKLHLH